MPYNLFFFFSVVCCNTITVSSTTQSVVDDWTGNKILGTFTYTAGDDINDRGIYRGNTDAYYAVKTVSAGLYSFFLCSIAFSKLSEKVSRLHGLQAQHCWELLLETAVALQQNLITMLQSVHIILLDHGVSFFRALDLLLMTLHLLLHVLIVRIIINQTFYISKK